MGKLKSTCKCCDRNFKVLTKEGLCAYCYKNEKGFWAKRFTNAIGQNGQPSIGQMKFKSKVKK